MTPGIKVYLIVTLMLDVIIIPILQMRKLSRERVSNLSKTTQILSDRG